MHWSDVVLCSKKAQLVDIEDQLQARAVSDKKSTVPQSVQNIASGAKTPNEHSAESDHAKERVVLLNPEEYLIQFGPKTLDQLTRAVRTTYKLFWDGSISLYQDTAYSSSNNKEFLNALLEMRTNTQQD
jgi:hypothetical protein